ncbi:Gcv operon activator [Agrobacterium sp. DSM 25558]|uniref:transcriptional regulator GcvA n=1 Tax=Agrobacterium sp. DSM 25558 TaxID=1907665 RepID=UPI00097249D8|nr:transcriptional regulator GcvA [Agrobacterium sp. DSM 25558]SCX22956.1 Gcv operon activator [Agrobacterium sp. DSM 25558]
MPKNLPPLSALRAFAMAGRYESFKVAAENLNVSPGAVSQHVKNLEKTLGIALFDRSNRIIRLTPKGSEYLKGVQSAFDLIKVATKAVTEDIGGGKIVVSTMPSFASQWLVPRLGRFRERHPQFDVHVNTATDLVRFESDHVDLAIRHGLGQYRGLYSERLFTVEMVVVCSPDFGTKANNITDLTMLPLLHEAERSDWALWFRANGFNEVDCSRGPSFDDDTSLVHAAISGQGVALVRDVLVVDHIAKGRLVSPVDLKWPSKFAYYCVFPEEGLRSQKIRAFRSWLHEEIRGH